LGTEFLGQCLGSAVAVVVLEHELVGERGGELRVFGLTGDLGQRLGGVVLRVLSALVPGKVKMAEAVATGQSEPVAVLVEPGFEFCSGWLVSGGHIFGEELHLLRHAALHDGVVFIEAHGQRLAVEDFLADLVFHHGLKLGRCRLAVPLRLEVHVHLLKFIKGQSNLPRRFDPAATTVHVTVNGEEGKAQQQKMQEGLAQPAFQDKSEGTLRSRSRN